MSNTPATNYDEIDILNLIESVWNGKWIIASTIVISCLSLYGYNFLKPNTTFTASTEIKPITSVVFDEYGKFNASLKVISKEKDEKNEEKDEKNEGESYIFKITEEFLLNLYVEEIEEGTLLETSIDKFNLVNKDNFSGENDYKDAVQKFASDIKVIKPIQKKIETHPHHILRAEFNDKDKWKNLLTYVNNEANRKVKANIINRFATLVSIENQKNNFAIKDIQLEIDNIREDYEKSSLNRLAF